MAYNYSNNDINYKDPLNSRLFREGFENDKTPLDEYNLNLILTAIKLIEQGRTQEDTKIQTRVDNEKTAREAADNSLQTQLNDEKASREDADKKLYGSDIPEENNLTLTGIMESLGNIDTDLKAQITTKENTFGVIITDGGGVPPSVIDGTDTTWNGEFEEV